MTDSDPIAQDTSAGKPEKASLAEDFIDVLYAPSNVFARRQNASFWPPLLVVTLAIGLFFVVTRGTLEPVFDAEYDRAMARAMEQNPQMTGEMAEQGRGFARIVATIGAFLGPAIGIFLVGLVLMLVGRGFGATISYATALVVTAYANVPRVIGAVVTALQGLLLDTTAMDGIYRLSIGPARFMDPDTMNPALVALVARVDLFVIWVTVLLGIGLAVAGKIPRSKAFAAAAIVWVIGSVPSLWSLLRS